MNDARRLLTPLLENFGRAHGLGLLRLGTAGVCTLDFDETPVVLEAPPGATRAVLYAPLGLLPPETEARARLLERALRASLFGDATHGAWCAIRKDELVLNLTLQPALLTDTLFANVMENFLTTLARLQDDLWLAEETPEKSSSSGDAAEASSEEDVFASLRWGRV